MYTAIGLFVTLRRRRQNVLKSNLIWSEVLRWVLKLGIASLPQHQSSLRERPQKLLAHPNRYVDAAHVFHVKKNGFFLTTIIADKELFRGLPPMAVVSGSGIESSREKPRDYYYTRRTDRSRSRSS